MKRIVLGSLAVLLALSLVMAAACDLDGIGGGAKEIKNPGVVYSKDGSSLTMYLDGNAPVSGGLSVADSSRALTTAFAKIGLEKFEVVFSAGTEGLARASWELGKPVSIKGVPRGTGAAGITYSPTPANIATVGQGGAILFAGRKNGTLLAVGKIVAIDGAGVNPAMTTAVINDTTKSVTFGLSALTADVNATTSSFAITSGTTGTAEVRAKSGMPYFKGFLLQQSVPPVTATYTFDSSSTSFTIAQILPNLIVKSATQVVVPLTPRYPMPFGQYWEFPQPYASGFSATIDTSTPMAANTALSSNVLNLSVTTGTTNGIISFYFEIPILALVSAATADGIQPEDWYIRTGHDFNLLDVNGGTGPNVFLYITADSIAGITALDYRGNDLDIIITGP